MRRILRECVNHARRKNPSHPMAIGNFYRHFAFVVQGTKIVESSTNYLSDAPKFRAYPSYATIHAEYKAYERASGLLGGEQFSLISIRLSKSGELRNAKPCAVCEQFLRDVGCVEVHYTNSEGIFEKLRF